MARLSVAQLKPEDVIVIESDDRISSEAAQRINEMAGIVWPGRKIVVLDKGLRLKVVAGSEMG